MKMKLKSFTRCAYFWRTILQLKAYPEPERPIVMKSRVMGGFRNIALMAAFLRKQPIQISPDHCCALCCSTPSSQAYKIVSIVSHVPYLKAFHGKAFTLAHSWFGYARHSVGCHIGRWSCHFGAVLGSRLVMHLLNGDYCVSVEPEIFMLESFCTPAQSMNTMFECISVGRRRFYSRPFIEDASPTFAVFWA